MGGSIITGWIYVLFPMPGWLPVLLTLPLIWPGIYFLLLLMLRIFVSVASHQSVLRNLILMPAQQVALFHYISEGHATTHQTTNNMERTNHLKNISGIIMLFVFVMAATPGQASDRDSIFYHCYTTTDMEIWKQTMHQMEKEYQESGSYKELFELTLAWYGYIGYCIGNDRQDEAEEYLKDGWKYLDLLLESPHAGAAAYSMKSGFYGFEMALAKYKAVILGRKSVKALEKAAEIDSNNVHYHVQKGNQMYYMPSFLGGDDEVALHHYKKAVDAIESGKVYHQRHWFYMNTLVVLAHTYKRTDNIEKARQTYLKIMEQAPQFEWVKEELWPDFVEKHGR